MSLLISGPTSTAHELIEAAATRLEPDRIIRLYGAAPPADLLAPEGPRYRRRHLVVWHGFAQVEPEVGILDAIRRLSPIGGLWLVAHTTEPAAEAFAQVFAQTASARLSTAELRSWVQCRLGGTAMSGASALLAACPEVDDAANAVRLVRLACEQASPRDVAELVPRRPERLFVDALLELRHAEAMAIAPLVADRRMVVGELERTLLAIWAMAEARPPVTTRQPREVAASLSLPVGIVSERSKLCRLYSRQKVRSRLEALAIVDAELCRCPGVPGALEVLVGCW